MRAAALFAALALLGVSGGGGPGDGWQLVVLGVAQDGGLPHLGCNRERCAAARAGSIPAQKVACLGLVNRARGEAYLFDATPDLTAQVHALTGGPAPDGVFLTHAHIGHYIGLVYLGKEAAAARAVPVHATPRMAAFLRQNQPWRTLVEQGHVALRPVEPDSPVELPGGVTVTSMRVPHRDELSDTVGYRIAGPRATALFVPDIDRWESWDRDIRSLAEEVDLLFLDGTFGSAAELPNRSIAEIPHPLVSHTRELLRGTRARLLFIHLNHSNREWDARDVAREGMELPI
jgi:pyrroloquinoline quinone biosynthesis protein B